MLTTRKPVKGEAEAERSRQSRLKGHVYNFLRLSWCCPFKIPSIRPNSQQRLLFEYYRLRESIGKNRLESPEL